MESTIPQNLIPHFILEQHHLGNARGHFQAATLFVDLTGFTPLTETLMRHEKDGAETLAEALREIFSPLVHNVSRRGGIIPIFAGDAFTAIFPVTERSQVALNNLVSPAIDAARRAVNCAQAIQQWMAGEGSTVETRYGTFALAVTAGISFGEVRWGIPGQSATRGFYFRGEAVDGCAAAEHEAEVGEVIVDAKIRQLLGAQIEVAPLADNDFAKLHPNSVSKVLLDDATAAPPPSPPPSSQGSINTLCRRSDPQPQRTG